MAAPALGQATQNLMTITQSQVRNEKLQGSLSKDASPQAKQTVDSRLESLKQQATVEKAAIQNNAHAIFSKLFD